MGVKCIIWLAKCFAKLPKGILFKSVYIFYYLGYPFAQRRFNIARINIQKCFPDLNSKQQHKIIRSTILNVIKGGIETLIAWCWSDQKINSNLKYKYIGREYLDQAINNQKGIILCGAHFTCIEMIGRLFGQDYDFDLVYQKHKNNLFENWMTGSRLNYVKKCIDKSHVKSMIKSLRSGNLLWYAPDQDMGSERSVFVDFFKIKTSAITATARLAQLGKAQVLPVFFYQSKETGEYIIEFKPILDHFPSGDDLMDTQRYYSALEKYIQKLPDQYLWTHRRFKTRPEGEVGFY